MGILKKIATASALAGGLNACSVSPIETPAEADARVTNTVRGAGGVLCSFIEDARSRNACLLGTAFGAEAAGTSARTQAAQNVICEGTTSVTRDARRDNATGAIVYDTTRQSNSELCTGGRRAGEASPPGRIFFMQPQFSVASVEEARNAFEKLSTTEQNQVLRKLEVGPGFSN